MRHSQFFFTLLLLLFTFLFSGCIGKFHDIAQSGSVTDLKQEIKTQEDKQEALAWAATYGNSAQVEYLLKEGVDVNYKVNHKFRLYPVIVRAAGTNNLQIVKLLVAHGARINLQDDYGWTAVSSAAHNGYADMLRYLVDKGGDLYATNYDGKSAISILQQRGQTELIQELLHIQQKEKLEKQA
ncbi:MAG: ankyrin repeat domain-containing protein [Sulfurimonas sp.]|nr:ankyrin repeat domain-containing protein [Sulfurimonas sp.]